MIPLPRLFTQHIRKVKVEDHFRLVHAARYDEVGIHHAVVPVDHEVGINPVVKRAVALPQALEAAREAIAGGGSVAEALRSAKQSLIDAGFLKIDYFALVDDATLEPLEVIQEGSRLIAAASIGNVRLIDNLAV